MGQPPVRALHPGLRGLRCGGPIFLQKVGEAYAIAWNDAIDAHIRSNPKQLA